MRSLAFLVVALSAAMITLFATLSDSVPMTAFVSLMFSLTALKIYNALLDRDEQKAIHRFMNSMEFHVTVIADEAEKKEPV